MRDDDDQSKDGEVFFSRLKVSAEVHKDLFADLEQISPKNRHERIKMLASIGLLTLKLSNGLESVGLINTLGSDVKDTKGETKAAIDSNDNLITQTQRKMASTLIGSLGSSNN